MGNLSYCRFRNTLSDLRDCADALLDGPPEDASEFRAAERMRQICQDFLDAADCLDDYRACGKGCGQVIGLREVCDCGEED